MEIPNRKYKQTVALKIFFFFFLNNLTLLQKVTDDKFFKAWQKKEKFIHKSPAFNLKKKNCTIYKLQTAVIIQLSIQ